MNFEERSGMKTCTAPVVRTTSYIVSGYLELRSRKLNIQSESRSFDWFLNSVKDGQFGSGRRIIPGLTMDG